MWLVRFVVKHGPTTNTRRSRQLDIDCFRLAVIGSGGHTNAEQWQMVNACLDSANGGTRVGIDRR
jgi:hypothetical protein